MKTIDEILQDSRRALPPCSAIATENYTMITSLFEPHGDNRVLRSRLFHITFIKKTSGEDVVWEFLDAEEKECRRGF